MAPTCVVIDNNYLLLIIIIEPTVDHELPTIGTTVDHEVPTIGTTVDREQTSATSLGDVMATGKNQCFFR